MNARIKKETPLIDRVKEGLVITDDYLKKIDINSRDDRGNNALYWAIKQKHRYNIQMLLENKISLEVSYRIHALSHAIVCDDYGTFIEIYKKDNLTFKLFKKALFWKRKRIIFYILCNNK